MIQFTTGFPSFHSQQTRQTQTACMDVDEQYSVHSVDSSSYTVYYTIDIMVVGIPTGSWFSSQPALSIRSMQGIGDPVLAYYNM
eukprot:COSAG02_NODE_54163_length_297_cov_1.297980_1_plen_83_part_01